MSECMNLLFLLAAPRVYASCRWSSPEPVGPESAEASLARFVDAVHGIRERATASPEEMVRLAQAAGICQDLRRCLPGARFDDALPEDVVEPARRALAALGFPPPAGGWDSFDGFPVPIAQRPS
ncbi:MAG TPA: Nif11-like leader peptide family natural product precursor [Candidatus Nanopelagicales bacterium]|nr:Nif11-like leader peptide family natural product precursor [Candidatus Nanopelagicales bacterium]